MIITIDGPAGTGKSTIAKLLASRLQFFFLDTGALYRALGYALASLKIDYNDEAKISDFLSTNSFSISQKEDGLHYTVGNIDTTPYLRTQEAGKLASIISVFPTVRTALLPIQQSFANSQNIVCEGRDTGTTIFPNADVKVYLTANKEIRAKRRYLELNNPKISFESILQEIEERDTRDTNRAISPLKQPPDAFVIDTSYLSIPEITDHILALVPRWEHFRHQADVGLIGIGHSLSQAFEQAACALTAVITDPSKVSPAESISISCTGSDIETLLINWLNALLFQMDTRHMLFSKFSVSISDTSLSSTAWGEAIDIEKHRPAVEIKGATYHALSIKKDALGLWRAMCVVDV
jgi:cytidylate kinase